MRVSIVLLFFTAALCLASPAQVFNNFVVRHGRRYASPAERQHRFEIFKTNLAMIERLNVLGNRDGGNANFGITAFSDMTREEFEQKYLSSTKAEEKTPLKTWDMSSPRRASRGGPLPAQWDWREHGVVTPSRAQLECGSCWAFSSAANMESSWAINGNPLQVFSPQQLLDCVSEANGCGGGSAHLGGQYVVKSGGIQLDKDYPYEMRQDVCRFDSNRIAASFSDVVRIATNDTALMEAIYEIGPISMGVYANAQWQNYAGGVFKSPICKRRFFNHDTLVVGWGTDPQGGDYWLVKNSWGPSWGMDGYIKLDRGTNCNSQDCTTVIY